MSGDLVSAFDALRAGGVSLTPSGLRIDDPSLTFVRWEKIGAALGGLGDCVRFALGDWILTGEALFGESAYQGAAATGLKVDTLRGYLWVAQRIPPSRRRVGRVPWSLHRLVARLEPDEQVAWLDRAEDDRLTYRELKAQFEAVVARATPEAEAAASPEGENPVDPNQPRPSSSKAGRRRLTTAPAAARPAADRSRRSRFSTSYPSPGGRRGRNRHPRRERHPRAVNARR